jgi:hypothetical protein
VNNLLACEWPLGGEGWTTMMHWMNGGLQRRPIAEGDSQSEQIVHAARKQRAAEYLATHLRLSYALTNASADVTPPEGGEVLGDEAVDAAPSVEEQPQPVASSIIARACPKAARVSKHKQEKKACSGCPT